MVALVVVLGALAAFAAGYFFYARWIGDRIYEDSEEIRTPAYEYEDGRDFVPTGRHILFGHHFTSIAGAAPIIGPCIAAYWGVLPALLWVVLGTIFIGAVHDFGALVLSVRQGGRTIADIAGTVITPRVRLMFLTFVMVLSWLVVAVFAMAIAGLFVTVPSSVMPVNLEIFVALVMGWLIYKKKVDALIPSIIALGLLYFFVWLGPSMAVQFTATDPADSIAPLGWTTDGAMTFWTIFLLIYAGIASLLPVWLLLQPRDFINSHQLVVGLGLLFLGILIERPAIDAEWIRTDGNGPSMIPFLFVTIACGAISGFHGLVSSGTTSKQIRSLRDARMIGYGSMLGEGSLALVSVLAAVSGIALVGSCTVEGIGPVNGWSSYYANFNQSKSAAWPFVHGGAEFLSQGLGVSNQFAITMMAVLVVSFAATTLDTATRIQRFIITELGSALKIQPLTNRYVATLLALAPAVVLIFAKATDPGTGQTRPVARILWPIFGASNQMLASLTLMVLCLYFWQRKRPVLPLLIPMLLVMAITITALFLKTAQFLGQDNWLLVGLNSLMIAMIAWMILEGVAMVSRLRRQG